MIIKEYRIPLPFTVEEYHIAHLYMVWKKTRQEILGKGSGIGVEILVNEPYFNGLGGNGQYTHKIFHLESKIPTWIRKMLPYSAKKIEEKSWNAYPYIRTFYTCPFLENFYIEVETKHISDEGHQENVFNLSGKELQQRIVDFINIANDPVPDDEYKVEEDPRFFVSRKTGRGPLPEKWIDEYYRMCKGRDTPLPDGKTIMCAYKLCRVRFRYLGFQAKVENYIHEIPLRRTFLLAHREMWTWQDEWFGMTIEDIRNLEREMQKFLAETVSKTAVLPAEEDKIQATSSQHSAGSPFKEKPIHDETQPDENKCSSGPKGKVQGKDREQK